MGLKDHRGTLESITSGKLTSLSSRLKHVTTGVKQVFNKTHQKDGKIIENIDISNLLTWNNFDESQTFGYNS
jgi:hypothetical protein